MNVAFPFITREKGRMINIKLLNNLDSSEHKTLKNSLRVK